jgi:outer membrane protein assembly factor BamB
VTSHDTGVLALDAADGRERWRFEDASGVAEPVAVANETVVAGGTEGELLALEAEDGIVRWEGEIEGSLGPPTVAGETILVGETHGKWLHARSLADGSERWRFETRRIPFGDYSRAGMPVGPTAVGETVFVPTAASDCYALGSPVGSATAEE